MEKHELNQLETDIRALQATHAALASSDALNELFNIIHRPGWTSVAELAFVRNGVDSIHSQVKQLTAFTQGLVTAAKQVGIGRAAGA